MDVMIFRIPNGWLRFEEITQQSLQESIQLAHELFGVTKVILVDLPFNNNVLTEQDWMDRQTNNQMIQQMAQTYHHNNDNNNTGGVRDVVVLQFARWTDLLMEFNARRIGLIPATEPARNKSYALARLGCRKKFPLSIAQGCAEYVTAGQCRCRRNRISHDGMHWCLETLGGRFVAGVACMLSCLYDDRPTTSSRKDSDDHHRRRLLRQCEKGCNDQYMSLQPLDFQDGVWQESGM